jgi:glycosyltransferase involved in cell wall biosynthesis
VRAEHPLVVVGPRGWEVDELLRSIAGADDVRLLGFVPDEDLAGLYELCTVFAYPSLYEGFGLPVLEAMQSGAPVVTSNVSSLPEVGGDAVRYVDPRSVQEIREAVLELLESPARRADLARRGRARAAGFSWDRAGVETLTVLGRLAEPG